MSSEIPETIQEAAKLCRRKTVALTTSQYYDVNRESAMKLLRKQIRECGLKNTIEAQNYSSWQLIELSRALHEEDILRVCGRLKHANIYLNVKNPASADRSRMCGK